MPVFPSLFQRLADTSPAMSLFQPNPKIYLGGYSTKEDPQEGETEALANQMTREPANGGGVERIASQMTRTPMGGAQKEFPIATSQDMTRASDLGSGEAGEAALREYLERPKSPTGAMSEKPPAPGAKVLDYVKAQSEKQADPNHQLRYEDIAPHLEQIPQTPQFHGKAHYGIMDRIKLALAGLAMGSQMQSGKDPMRQDGGMLGGALAGIFSPKGVAEQGFNMYTLPRAASQQKGVMDRNNQRLQAFDRELKAREAIAKINSMGGPKWHQGTGAQYPFLYNESSGEYKGIMNDGEPVEAASVVTGRGHDTTRKIVEKGKIKANTERDETRHGYKLDELDVTTGSRERIAEAARKAAMERLRVSEGGRNSRLGISESGRNKRQGIAIDAKENGGISGKGGNAGPARPGGGAPNGTGPEGQSESMLDHMSPTQKKRWESIKKLRQSLGSSSPEKTKL